MQLSKLIVSHTMVLLNSNTIVTGFLTVPNGKYNRVSGVPPECSVMEWKPMGVKWSPRSRLGVASSEGVSTTDSISSPTPPAPPDMEAYASGYTTVFEELPSANFSPTFGTLPPDLQGSYYRSGPSMFSAGSLPPPKLSIVQPKEPPTPDGQDPERMVQHPFDADGGILGVTFSGDGSLTARFRYVRTNAFDNERKKGKRLYSGMESTRLQGSQLANGQGNDFPTPLFRHHLRPGLNKSRKNTSNTRAVYWSKKLLTLWEGGLPYKVDSLALSTEGRSQLGGVLLEAQSFSGSARYDPVNQRMLFYANVQDAGGSELTVYEFDERFKLVKQVEHRLKTGLALISDFGVTEGYTVFVQPEVGVNGMAMMMDKSPGKSLKVDQGAGSYLHLLSRNSDKTITTIPIQSDGISDADLQFCNSYEENDNGQKSIVFDVIRSDGTKTTKGGNKPWPWVSSLQDFQESSSQKSLWRYRYRNGKVEKERLSSRQASFGVINPEYSGKKHRYIYATIGALGSEVAPPQGIARFDTDTNTEEVWFPNEYEFCGEPIYAPRSDRPPRRPDGDDESTTEPSPSPASSPVDDGEDGGYIISVLLNGKTGESQVIVFNANSISSGPISRVGLGMRVPHGLHGCFTASEDACWSADEIERRARLADKMEGKGNRWNEVKSDFSGLGLRLDDFEEYFGDIL